MLYEVTLVQKVKSVQEAQTPQQALEQAKQKSAGVSFEPHQFSVKEKS